MEIPVPPTRARPQGEKCELLPSSLEDAVRRFKAPDSVARELFDGQFVEFFAATREHELRLWKEAVTDW
jgi:glutamine synthetase